MSNPGIRTTLSEELKGAFEAKAEDLGMSVSSLMRNLIISCVNDAISFDADEGASIPSSGKDKIQSAIARYIDAKAHIIETSVKASIEDEDEEFRRFLSMMAAYNRMVADGDIDLPNDSARVEAMRYLYGKHNGSTSAGGSGIARADDAPMISAFDETSAGVVYKPEDVHAALIPDERDSELIEEIYPMGDSRVSHVNVTPDGGFTVSSATYADLSVDTEAKFIDDTARSVLPDDVMSTDEVVSDDAISILQGAVAETFDTTSDETVEETVSQTSYFEDEEGNEDLQEYVEPIEDEPDVDTSGIDFMDGMTFDESEIPDDADGYDFGSDD